MKTKTQRPLGGQWVKVLQSLTAVLVDESKNKSTHCGFSVIEQGPLDTIMSFHALGLKQHIGWGMDNGGDRCIEIFGRGSQQQDT